MHKKITKKHNKCFFLCLDVNFLGVCVTYKIYSKMTGVKAKKKNKKKLTDFCNCDTSLIKEEQRQKTRQIQCMCNI